MDIVPVQNASSSYDIDDTVEISAGEYWKHEGGNVHLISSLNIIDNELHSIEVSPHPRYGGGGRFMSDEFFSKFVPITHEEAESIRSVEIKEVESEMNQIKLEMDAGYHDEDGISAKLLMERVSSSGMAQISISPDAAHKQIEVIGEKSKALQEIAQKQAEFIQEKSKAIATKTSLIASYYTEKGKQALASVDHTMKCVKKLQKSVYTLEVFTGKGVTVSKIRDGEPAPQDEPLTFYQRKLYLDEEWFFSLDSGGLDFQNMTDFKKALQDDFSIIDRIAPSPRSVVLMQYRRKDKSYFPKGHEKSIGDIFYECGMNDANKERILLIRNGGMVHIVKTEDIENGVRLFPTAVEIDDNYRVSKQKRLFNGMTIDANDQKLNPKDLGYVEARNSHEEKTVYYQRVILILCGVHLRDNDVFGDFKNSNQFDNWFNEVFQHECCRFIHDDEDALSDGKMPVQDWIEKKNSIIQSGTRIVCSWFRIMNEDTAPNAVKVIYGQRYDQTVWSYKPLRSVDVAVVKSSHGELYVEAECRSVKNGAIRKVKVYFARDRWLKNLFAIDTASYEEINYYLESRRHREHYFEYVDIFMHARKVIKEEEDINRPFINAMNDGVLKALPQCNSEEVRVAVNEAVRMWRAGNNGKLLPVPSDKEYKKVLGSIGEQVWSILSGDAVEAVEAYCNENGIRPSLVSMNGSGEYEVIVPDLEILDDAGVAPFATSLILKRNSQGFCVKDTVPVLNSASSASRIVREYPYERSEFAQKIAHPTLAPFVEYMKPIIEISVKRLYELHNGGHLTADEVKSLVGLYVDCKNSWGGEYVFFPMSMIVHNENTFVFGLHIQAGYLLGAYALPEHIDIIREYMIKKHWNGRDKVDSIVKYAKEKTTPFEFYALRHDARKAYMKPKHFGGIIESGELNKLGGYYSIHGEMERMYSNEDDFTEFFKSNFLNSTKKSWVAVSTDKMMNKFFPFYDPQRMQTIYSCTMHYEGSKANGSDSGSFEIGPIVVTDEEMENAGINTRYRLDYFYKIGYPKKAHVRFSDDYLILEDTESRKIMKVPLNLVKGWRKTYEEFLCEYEEIVAENSSAIFQLYSDWFSANSKGEFGRVHKRIIKGIEECLN